MHIAEKGCMSFGPTFYKTFSSMNRPIFIIFFSLMQSQTRSICFTEVKAVFPGQFILSPTLCVITVSAPNIAHGAPRQLIMTIS